MFDDNLFTLSHNDIFNNSLLVVCDFLCVRMVIKGYSENMLLKKRMVILKTPTTPSSYNKYWCLTQRFCTFHSTIIFYQHIFTYELLIHTSGKYDKSYHLSTHIQTLYIAKIYHQLQVFHIPIYRCSSCLRGCFTGAVTITPMAWCQCRRSKTAFAECFETNSHVKFRICTLVYFKSISR